MAPAQAVRSTMRYRITSEPEYLKAELFDRRTAEETGTFLSAVATEYIRRRCYRVLISVRSSKPIFTIVKYGLSSFIDIAVRYSGQIAVLADSPEIRIAHEYAVMLARLRGVNVRTFREEGGGGPVAERRTAVKKPRTGRWDYARKAKSSPSELLIMPAPATVATRKNRNLVPKLMRCVRQRGVSGHRGRPRQLGTTFHDH